jgi:hypothetical protein
VLGARVYLTYAGGRGSITLPIKGAR